MTYKLSYIKEATKTKKNQKKKATRIYCITQGIQPIFYNNYKWRITFKNCESLYCTSVTYNIGHQLYFTEKQTHNK